MKNLPQLLGGTVILALVTGCSTIEYSNSGTTPDTTEVYGGMHHNLAYSLYEYSSPVDLAQCNNDWASLVVERDVITAIAGSIDNAFGVDVWDPWAVTLNCAQ